MTILVIITLCVLVLLAYLFDISSSVTKIPSVILLLLLGWIVKQSASQFDIIIPNLTNALPILGTIGLILIVLEGSLELELNKSKIPLVKKSFVVALVPMLVLSFLGAFAFQQFMGYEFRMSMANMVPLAVISSSIAIPSAKNLSSYNRQFVTYESSLSDILGVILFNFVALTTVFNIVSIGLFLLQIIIIIVVSFLATIALSFLLGRIEHEIKFVPIILLVILIYEVSKVFHLPSLVFILVFGLFLGNLDEMKHMRWIQKLKPVSLDTEVHKFLDFIREITFLIKALFFLLFGFLINTSDLLNTHSLAWSSGITVVIFLVRAVQLKLSGLPVKPLVFVAPRGLINILLFLSLPVSLSIPLVDNSLVIQVMILTALVMMIGLMITSESKQPDDMEDLEIRGIQQKMHEA
ncbi:cation:proton antiporter [Ferruginibacter sp. HRS2-29]|uniref:cation:proton antiporter domain-containing protein n=1 Tax=Ferruginibacter sp. HRS2-29 TaxID=2487334 RepID=UPI0020CF2417|nr:cation:proton antiporter [Ferruginibacter sp. HRS2-29]MCP9752199.1 sodium:proton antiporter [Ferruginibacter sp. HRS2-29]